MLYKSNFLVLKGLFCIFGLFQLGSVDGSGALSEECESAIETLFDLIDVDGDGSISRQELDLFQIICTGEKFEDEDWNALSVRNTLFVWILKFARIWGAFDNNSSFSYIQIELIQTV